MHHAAAVQIRHGRTNLARNVPDLLDGKWLHLLLKKLLEVNTAVFKHDVYMFVMATEKSIFYLKIVL